MSGTEKRKQSIYFSAAALKEITDEATRLDRSLSWIVQKAWKLAKKEIMRLPTTGGGVDDRDVHQAEEDHGG